MARKQPLFLVIALLPSNQTPCLLDYGRLIFRDPLYEALDEAGQLTYRRRVLAVDIHQNDFAGLPRPELDAAWHNLFESKWKPYNLL